MKLEAHITFEDVTQATRIEKVGFVHGFKFSKIDGDEEMGPGVKCYLTRSDPKETISDFRQKMFDCCNALKGEGVQWQRRKIEQIIHDERYIP